MRGIVVSVLFFLGVLASALAQHDAWQNFQKVQDEFTTLHFYPSTIRMLGKYAGGQNPAAFTPLKRAKLTFTLSKAEEFRTAMRTFAGGHEAARFEMVAQLRNQGFDVSFYLKDDKQHINLFFYDGPIGLFSLEVQGELTTELMQQLLTLDIETAASGLGIFKSDQPDMAVPDSTSTSTP